MFFTVYTEHATDFKYHAFVVMHVHDNTLHEK